MKLQFLDLWGQEVGVAIETDNRAVGRLMLNGFQAGDSGIQIAIDADSSAGTKVEFWSEPEEKGACVQLFCQKDGNFLF